MGIKEDGLMTGSYYFIMACIIFIGLMTPYVYIVTNDKS